jgi:hypothetical protein
MVLTSDHQKVNLGLSIKFEAKALKVVGYSRKETRYWEYTDKAVDLLREYKASDAHCLTSYFCLSRLSRPLSRRYSRNWTMGVMVRTL